MSLQKLFFPVGFCFLLFGCASEQKDGKLPFATQDSILANPPQKQIDGEEKVIDESNYDIVFESANQKLFVKWVNEDSIQYSLNVKTPICTENYSGGAFELISADNFEIDEDNEGAYPVREFTVDQLDYELYIRIAVDSSKAKILFEYNYNGQGKKTCQPKSGVVMKKK